MACKSEQRQILAPSISACIAFGSKVRLKEDARGFSVLSNPWDVFPSSWNVTRTGTQLDNCSSRWVRGLRARPVLCAGLPALECCLGPDFGTISLHYPFRGMQMLTYASSMYKSCPLWEGKSDYFISHEAKAPGSGCFSLSNIDITGVDTSSLEGTTLYTIRCLTISVTSVNQMPATTPPTTTTHTHSQPRLSKIVSRHRQVPCREENCPLLRNCPKVLSFVKWTFLRIFTVYYKLRIFGLCAFTLNFSSVILKKQALKIQWEMAERCDL